jgi:long-chain acyl-CoA synthetase
MKEPAARSLEYWASVRGGDIALVDGDVTFTYKNWNDHADLLAATLAGRGIGFDDVIAVRTRTRMEWAIIAAAASKVGARLLSFDRRLSPLAVRDMMIDSGAVAVFVDGDRPQDFLGALSPPPLRLRATLDVSAPGFMDFNDLFPPAAAPRFAPCFVPLVVYVPADVDRVAAMIQPRQLVAPASRSRPPAADHGASLVSVCLTSALGYRQVDAALRAGRRIVFMRRFDTARALDLVEQHAITEWTLSTSSCVALQALPVETVKARDLRSLTQVSAVTGHLNDSTKRWLVEALGQVLFESYSAGLTGPLTLMPPEAGRRKPGSYGRAMPGVTLEIRDSTGQALPPNCAGDIWVRASWASESLMNGVQFAPDMRDARGFIRAGDIGRLDEDGYLFVAGRAEAAYPRRPAPASRVMPRTIGLRAAS